MKQPPMTTLDTLAVQERRLYLNAEKRLGHAYVMAREATLLLTMFMKSVSADRVVFCHYMAQLKKHQTLALLSIVRLHHVQAMMNFRQVLESAANAAFALANPAATYIDPDTGLILDAQGVLLQSYRWIAKAFPGHSADIENFKKRINANDSHSNLANSGRIVEAKWADGIIATPFFDKEDAHIQQTDLFQLTVGALCIMDLLVRVMAKHGGFVIAPDYAERARRLEADRKMLADQMTATPRHKAATEAGAKADAAKTAAKAARAAKQRSEGG
jgi:hypothetical protein